MVRAMGNPWFGSKATSGLCQALIALMPRCAYRDSLYSIFVTADPVKTDGGHSAA